MSVRAFTTSARAFLKWAGFDKNKLEPGWKAAVEQFTKPGGQAESVRYPAHLDSFR
jgi:hypothetical protein